MIYHNIWQGNMNPNTPELVIEVVAIGIGATALLDLWALFAGHVLGLPVANWARVGRWLGYFPKGRFVHHDIAAAPPIARERLIGWSAHYIIGIFYATVLFLFFGSNWISNPTLAPALAIGLATVVAPFFIMQPAMGAGIAAANTPNPLVARLSSILGHSVFGFGLYLSALVLTMPG